MCRFALYLGPPITLDLLISKPAHSIIRQSFKSRLLVEPLNGDGFGVAWYVPEISPQPAAYRSTRPAWNNLNLRDLARVTRSGTILAHVRAATPGLEVMESNTHPFTMEQFAFMHNGSVPHFDRLKRPIHQRLSDEAFSLIRGTTDSEHAFALWLDHYRRLVGGAPHAEDEALAESLRRTIAQLAALVRAEGASRPALLNFAVTDGRAAAVSRYTTNGDGYSLFYITGRQFVWREEGCHMLPASGPPTAVLVASEPLTEEPGWQSVPDNHLLLIGSDRSLTCTPLT